jgi:3-methyladenine DNA glycosylase AlkD
MEKFINQIKHIKHGFADIQKLADEIIKDNSDKEIFNIAKRLFSSEIHQGKMLATFLFGKLAAKYEKSLNFLKQQVSKDENWRVQEILAKAFDQYCFEIGYQQALSTIDEWLEDPNPNVRRAVTEGLRVWTNRSYFKEHPEVAINSLCKLKNDSSEYVRKSVGNALRDISKKYKELIKSELSEWNLSDNAVKQTHKLASRLL